MRKVLLFVITTIFFSSYANAQISKGSVLLGGGISFLSLNEKVSNPDSKQNSISFTPVIGIAVRENLVAGVQLMYGHSKNEISSTQETESNNFQAGIFIRKYLTLGKGFYLFGQSGLYYNSSKYNYTYPASKSEQKDHSVGINLYPGISYAVSKKFHLEAGLANLISLEYMTHKIRNNGIVTQETNGVNINANASSLSNINIGFRFFLAKKTK